MRTLLFLACFTLVAASFPPSRLKSGPRLPPEEFTDPPPLSNPSGCDNRLCWTQTEKWAVAHICWDEARGLLIEGLTSCAATIANRQAHPEVWGSADLNELLHFSQFAVISARTRPWERGEPPAPTALAAVEAFLASPTGPGCWGYDSFQASTPDLARDWLAHAPDRHCVLIRDPQALLFFNWRDG